MSTHIEILDEPTKKAGELEKKIGIILRTINLEKSTTTCITGRPAKACDVNRSHLPYTVVKIYSTDIGERQRIISAFQKNHLNIAVIMLGMEFLPPTFFQLK